MHSIPSVAVHPNGKWLCGQSLDNQIVTYSALDKFRQNRKKVFKGHSSSGYACQVRLPAPGRLWTPPSNPHDHTVALDFTISILKRLSLRRR